MNSTTYENIGDMATEGELKQTARLAGMAYLALAIGGIIGFAVAFSQLYEPGNGEASLANIVDNELLAHAGAAAHVFMAGAQAIVAFYLYKLFRHSNETGSVSLLSFGLMNSAMLLISSTLFSAVVTTALSDGATAESVLKQFELLNQAWKVSAIFAGLWLIPMGWLVWKSEYMPKLLGQLLILGGLGYTVSSFIGTLPEFATAFELLQVPAHIAELWMVGYLLIKGVRQTTK